MLQRILLAIGILNLLAIIILSITVFASDQKVVYVDSSKLLNQYKGMEAARAAYQQKANTWKANIDTLANEVQQQIFNYEKESKAMTAKERQLSQELIRNKQKQFGEYQQAMNTQAQQEDAKMTREVVTQINAYLKKYGEANGYKIILAATEYGNLAYADEGLDITDEVLTGLNKEYSGK
ncbi:MAG TPA: OmpH family outer membrane protein [Ohtaekwangia sp.]|uniref:OmpH family outer membrane protein n=1 Tax=Ohtaekwangia sp. TaxID=2066019 RepID=UPI002F922E62